MFEMILKKKIEKAQIQPVRITMDPQACPSYANGAMWRKPANLISPNVCKMLNFSPSLVNVSPQSWRDGCCSCVVFALLTDSISILIVNGWFSSNPRRVLSTQRPHSGVSSPVQDKQTAGARGKNPFADAVELMRCVLRSA